MDKININGDFYDEEKVIFKGKQSYKKRDNFFCTDYTALFQRDTANIKPCKSV